VFREISVLTSTVIEGNTVKQLISKGFAVVIDFLMHNTGLIVATCMVSRQALEGIIIGYIVYFTEKIRAVFYSFKKEK